MYSIKKLLDKHVEHDMELELHVQGRRKQKQVGRAESSVFPLNYLFTRGVVN